MPEAKPEVKAPSPPPPAPAKPAAPAPAKAVAKPFDVKTPKFTAKDLVAGLRNQLDIAGEKRLQALARKHPDVARLIKEKIAAKSK